ncbi:hypothetical protein [Metapseudomonas resinovorans]|uniref:hypothetical protein n=1 Tax=Metapseudomonas resinovorans TaxID=53412 RepID=UPI00042600F0|nr:hypothetical protein [Pseudomonas resinovorans]
MIEYSTDFSDFPPLPTYEAEWAAVYMEPIVQSGERLTIGVVASDGEYASGQLSISRKALECLYGESADGMLRMMELALQRALRHAKQRFDGQFRPGMHGVTLGKKRKGIGEDLEDIIEQGISLTSSLSGIHMEDDEKTGRDRSMYWLRFKRAMQKVNPNLVPYFGRSVDVQVRGSTISLACDYFSSRLAVNICALSPGYRMSGLFDVASSRIFRLEQLKDHDALIQHHQQAAMMLVIPTESQLADFKPGNQQSFRERVLLLQDMADKKAFPLITVNAPLEGAIKLGELEAA